MALITFHSENNFTIEYIKSDKKIQISSKDEIFSYLKHILNLWEHYSDISLDTNNHISDSSLVSHMEDFYKYDISFRKQDNKWFDVDISLSLWLFWYELDSNWNKIYWDLDSPLDFSFDALKELPAHHNLIKDYKYEIVLFNRREDLYFSIWEIYFEYRRHSGIIFSWPLYLQVKWNIIFDIYDFIKEIAKTFSPNAWEEIVWANI